MKKFGDVILTSEFRAKNIWMEYFPLLREDSFTEMDLIKVVYAPDRIAALHCADQIIP
mgnify:CR=1 FL=1